jgi:hypothetical protein
VFVLLRVKVTNLLAPCSTVNVSSDEVTTKLLALAKATNISVVKNKINACFIIFVTILKLQWFLNFSILQNIL